MYLNVGYDSVEMSTSIALNPLSGIHGNIFNVIVLIVALCMCEDSVEVN